MVGDHLRARTKITVDLHSRHILNLLTKCLRKPANEAELQTEAVGVAEAHIH
jgi:hypothetical protein